MIATKITMREGTGSFRAALRYVLRGQTRDGVHEDVAWTHIVNLGKLEHAAEDMYATASRPRADGKKTRARQYVESGIISYADGEYVDQQQATQDTLRHLANLGYDVDDHQIVLACHQDKDHLHVHYVVNRRPINKDNLVADNWDHVARERSTARISIERGYAPVEGWANKDIIAGAGIELTGVKFQQNKDPEIARRRGEDYAAEIRETVLQIAARSDGWGAFRAGLRQAGIEVAIHEPRRGKRGLTFGELPGQVPAGEQPRRIAGSKLDRSLSAKEIEGRFGPLDQAEQAVAAPAQTAEAAPVAPAPIVDFASEIRPAVMAAAAAATGWGDYYRRLAAVGLETHVIERGGRRQGLAIGERPERVAPGAQPRTIGASKIDPAVSIGRLSSRWGDWAATVDADMQVVDPHVQPETASAIAPAIATADLPASDDTPAEPQTASVWLADGVMDIYSADLGQLGLVDPPAAQPAETKEQVAHVQPGRPVRPADQEEEIQPPASRIEPPTLAAQARQARYEARVAAVIDAQEPAHDDHDLWSSSSARPSRLGRVDKDREIEAMGAVNEIWQEEKQIRRAEEALVTKIKQGATRYNKIRCKVEREILNDCHRTERQIVKSLMMDYGIVGLVLGFVLGAILAVRQADEQEELRRYQQWRRQVEREALQRHVRAHYAKYRVEYYDFVKMVAAGTPPAGIKTDDERQEHGRIALARIDRGRALQDKVWRKCGMNPELCRAHPVPSYLAGYKRLMAGDTSVEKGLDELAGAVMAMKRHSPTLVAMLQMTDLQARHDRLEIERIAKRQAAAQALAELRKRQLAAATEMVATYQEKLDLMRSAAKAGEVVAAGKISLELEDLAVKLARVTRSKHCRPPVPPEVKADMAIRLRSHNARARTAVPAAPPPPRQTASQPPIVAPRRPAAPPPPKSVRTEAAVTTLPTKPSQPPPPATQPAPAPAKKWWTDQSQ